MLNLLRKFIRPSLRDQVEAGVREALRRYADRRTAPDLRVYVSTDLLPPGVDGALWARDEADHLRRFAAQWAEDNNILRAGLRVEVVLLDTKREFAFVKPLGLEAPEPQAGAAAKRLVREAPAAAPVRPAAGARGGRTALFEVVSSPTLNEPLRLEGETIVGRRAEDGVRGMGDRYMSGRHARLRVDRGRVSVMDLDSKNRTFVNEQPLEPHQTRDLQAGDSVRMGTTVLRLTGTE